MDQDQLLVCSSYAMPGDEQFLFLGHSAIVRTLSSNKARQLAALVTIGYPIPKVSTTPPLYARRILSLARVGCAMSDVRAVLVTPVSSSPLHGRPWTCSVVVNQLSWCGPIV